MTADLPLEGLENVFSLSSCFQLVAVWLSLCYDSMDSFPLLLPRVSLRAICAGETGPFSAPWPHCLSLPSMGPAPRSAEMSGIAQSGCW